MTYVPKPGRLALPPLDQAEARPALPKPPREAGYAGIQALRAVAATIVAASHLVPFEDKYLTGPAVLPRWFEFGQCGVDIFFVVSGFIITRSVSGRFGSASEAGRFALRRAARIYPAYWVYFLVVLAVYLAAPRLVNSSAAGRPDLLLSFLLLPQAGPALVLVSWTLTYELFFYAAFALGMPVLRERALPLAVLLWGGALVVLNLALRPGPGQPVLNLVLNPLILEFLAGCLVCRALAARPSPKVRTVGAVLLGAGLVVLVGGTAVLVQEDLPFPAGWPRVLVFGGASVMVVAGAVALDPWLGPRIPRPVTALGDASYSLYLSHVLTIAAAGQAWQLLPATHLPLVNVLALASALALALATGYAAYRVVEAPLQAAVRIPQLNRIGRGR